MNTVVKGVRECVGNVWGMCGECVSRYESDGVEGIGNVVSNTTISSPRGPFHLEAAASWPTAVVSTAVS